jgi:glyoxylase-like metal-dependent hydrolase (beta-lactamase superfamily II)
MKTITVGDVTIDRVLEREGPFFELDFLLPDAPPDLLAANADWLMPRYVDPESGQIVMSFHSLLLRTPRHTILVDACVGNDKERPLRPFWHRAQFPYLQNLAALGAQPEDVDFVLCTHMHADHVGWNTRLLDGRWVPTFPNAQYIFAQREYDYWEEASRASAGGEPINHNSFNDSVLPVVEAGRAQLVADDHQIVDGIWLEPAPGHTPGNIVIHVARNGGRALLVGDSVHTPVQFAKPALSSRFCADPVQSAETRARLIDQVAETDTAFLTAHFPTPTAGRVVRKGEAFRFEAV